MLSFNQRLFWIVLSLAIPLELFASGNAAAQEVQPDPETHDASYGLTLEPLTPACPLPHIPLSATTLSELMGITPKVMQILSQEGDEERFLIRGDGTDAGLHPQVNQLLAERNFSGAFEFAQSIEDISTRNENLYAISRGLNTGGEEEQARMVALAMTEVPLASPQEFSGRSPFSGSNSLRDEALFYVAQSYWHEGQLDAAMELVEVMGRQAQFSPLLHIAEQYWNQGQQAAASATLERATTVYRELAATADTTDILRFWALARLLGFYINFAQEESRSQAADLTTELFGLAQTFPTQEYGTLDILTNVIITYIRADQESRATTALSYILDHVDVVTEPYLKAMLLAGVANQYAALGEGDRAAEIMAQAQTIANTENEPDQRNINAAIFALAYYQMDQPENALNVTTMVEPLGLREQIQAALACASSTVQPPPGSIQ